MTSLRKPRLFILLCLGALCASAQPLTLPASASTRLYFAQLADGGPAVQRWTTTILFVNPNAANAASISVSFYGDTGQPLPLDFGQGAKTTLQVSLPAGGAGSFTSTGASSSTAFVTGWALASSDFPVTGTVIYRAVNNGTPQLDVAAAGSGSSYYFNSFANANLGIALANPSSTRTIHLLVAAKDQKGASAGSKAVTLPPYGHTAFNFGPPGSGSVTITSSDSPVTPFVAWALNARDDLLGPLPAGDMQAPPPYDRRVYDVFARLKSIVPPLVAEAQQVPDSFITVSPDQILTAFTQLGISVDPDTTMRLSFQPADKKIHISQAMLEAMGSSDSALAFLLMRTAIIAVQTMTGSVIDTGTEESAQFWAVFSLLKTGYDPGGAMDCVSRIWYARNLGVPMDGALQVSLGIPISISAPLQYLAVHLPEACAYSPAFTKDCQAAHDMWHPHFPSQVP